MAALDAIVAYLDGELRTAEIPDYDGALNGLQLANDGVVDRVAAAVDFSLASVRAAVAAKARLLIVHHGMFWGGAQPLVGPTYERLRTALVNGLAVYASHIPLDLHATFGNNVLLAKELGLTPDATFGRWRGGVEIGVMGTCNTTTASLVQRVRDFSNQFATTAVATPFDPRRRTRRWAIITGAGASSDTLAEARERQVDTFIVGEGAHHTAVNAMESDIVVIYGGHYATETLGVRALGRRLTEKFDVAAEFVDIPTGL